MSVPTFPAEPAYVLRNATVPRTLLAQPQCYPGDGETVRLDLAAERCRIVRITPAGTGEGRPPVDLDGGMVWPCFTDIHTHLDKGHIWPRCPNPDGRHASARTAVAADRTAHWSAADVAARMRFALRAAYAATLADPEFLEETKKLNMETRPQTGAQVDALVKAVAATPQPVIDKTARMLGWKS